MIESKFKFSADLRLHFYLFVNAGNWLIFNHSGSCCQKYEYKIQTSRFKRFILYKIQCTAICGATPLATIFRKMELFCPLRVEKCTCNPRRSCYDHFPLVLFQVTLTHLREPAQSSIAKVIGF